MRYTELLKLNNSPKEIFQDGKKYQFTPGKGGSLMVQPPADTNPTKTPQPNMEMKELPAEKDRARVITAAVRG